MRGGFWWAMEGQGYILVYYTLINNNNKKDQLRRGSGDLPGPNDTSPRRAVARNFLT